MFVPLKNNKIIEKEYNLRREIPSGLTVDVDKGGQVKEDTVLASGEVSAPLVKVDLASALKIKPRDANKYLECLNGERVKKGDILARRSKKVVGGEFQIVASSNGVVDLSDIEAGFLKILGVAKENTISAGVEGKVVSIIQNRQIDILTTALKIKPFRIYGGGIQGEMFIIEDKRVKIGANLCDGIIALNFKVEKEYLRELALAGVRGIVIGGIESDYVKEMTSEGLWGMSVCILEGFGDIKIDVDFLPILRENDGKLCLIDAEEGEFVLTNLRDGFILSRNKLLWGELAIGGKVQIFIAKHWGAYGKVEAISGEMAKIRLEVEGPEQSVEIHENNLLICE
jgi:hypothetical protein